MAEAPAPPAPRVAVVIDYQNIHLTGHDAFATPGLAKHKTLVHPLRFAERVLAVRGAAHPEAEQRRAELVRVLAFRGQPGNVEDPGSYAATQAQQSEWTRDRRVTVTYLKLKYWQGRPPQEKGIDVLVALNLLRLAESGDYDVVILAAHDTDQEPALRMASEQRVVRVETAGWDRKRKLKPSRWHTALSDADFDAARDPRDYDPQYHRGISPPRGIPASMPRPPKTS